VYNFLLRAWNALKPSPLDAQFQDHCKSVLGQKFRVFGMALKPFVGPAGHFPTFIRQIWVELTSLSGDDAYIILL
jgi:hypothetical protein